MAQAEISIKVNIEERFYPLKIKINEEEGVRKAARYINEKSKFYAENFSMHDKQDCLAMVALEFATELLAIKRKYELQTNETKNKLSQTAELLQNAIIDS